MRSNEITPGRVSKSVALIRLMVGGIFLVEGILKFLYPAELAYGRFERIGLPLPHFFGPFVGGFEILCGALVLLGLFTRFAAIPLLVIISMAIVSTKIPILLGHGFAGFNLHKLAHYGFLSMVHEARADFSMWLGLVFLLIAGGGGWSLDAIFCRRGEPAAPVKPSAASPSQPAGQSPSESAADQPPA